MPRRKQRTLRNSQARDIEAVREVIQAGIPWRIPREQHYELTRKLTLEQKALLSYLTPFRSAAKFICDVDPELLAFAKDTLKADIAEARARRHA